MEICKTRVDYENEQMVLEHPTKMNPEHGSYVKLEYYQSLQAENKALMGEIKNARLYAKNIAVAIYKKHWKDKSPNWEVCQNLSEILSQIDNMTCKLLTPPKGE